MVVDKILKYLTTSKEAYNEEVHKALWEEFSLVANSAYAKLLWDQERDSKGKFYLSSFGKCARQNAYSYHGFEKSGRTIDARSMINFFMGDMVELAVVMLAVKAGVNINHYGENQRRVTLKFGEYEATGKLDGIIEHELNEYVLEVKSMTTYAFRDFEKGVINPDYIAQANAYMESLGLTHAVIVGVCKETGHMHEIILPINRSLIVNQKIAMSKVFQSTPEDLPDRKYEADEAGIYPWQCCYCSYWKHCHKNAEYVLKGRAYKLKEKNNVRTQV